MNRFISMIGLLLITGSTSAQLAMQAKVYLQGPYAGSGLMNARLYNLAGFPHSQPYNVAPWNYNGTETIVSVPDSVVDWVLAELRCAPDTIVDRRAALLLKNGKVVDPVTYGPVLFEHNEAGSYYLVIHHRNHLAVMSAAPVTLPNTNVYNFSDTLAGPSWGGGGRAQINLGSGVYGMITGDVNKNNQIKYSGPGNDRSLILQKIIQATGSSSITATTSGYHQEDITMDSIVKYSGPGNDPAKIIQNIVAMTGASAITGVYNGMVPPGVLRPPCTPQPQANAGPDTAICEGNCVELTATGGVSYLWSNQATTAQIQVCPNSTTTYTVTATDASGCSDSDNVTVTVNPLPVVTAGSDSFNIPGTGIRLQGSQPGTGTGIWNVISGSGGIFSNPSLYNTIFTGIKGAGYTLSWALTNTCGSRSDTMNIGFAPPLGIPCDTIIDARDGQQYPTVQIGTHCWMARNLNVGVYIPGSSGASDNGIIEKYCLFNDTVQCAILGGLYRWDEMMGYVNTQGAQGICPSGFHIPTDLEWQLLEGTVDSLYGVGNPVWNNTGFRGYDAGGKLKEAGTSHWDIPNMGASDIYGFTFLPGSYRLNTGNFSAPGMNGYCWTSTESSSNNAIYRGIYYDADHIYRDDYSKATGFSVRCLKDCTPLPDQANAGPDSLNIPGNSIQLYANQPVNGTGVWTIVTCNGSPVACNGTTIADSTQYNTMFYGQAGVSYTLSWTISNNCGSTTDSLELSFAQVPSLCGDTLIDTRDGQKYPIVQIGTQCWMGRNLNIGVMVNSIYTGVEHRDQNNNGVIEKYCYNNDSANCNIYGGLYEWNEMMGYMMTPGVQGICPAGWHVPADEEWTVLTDYLGGDSIAGGSLKEAGSAHWLSPNVGATNSSGFTALPGNARYADGVFSVANAQGLFWSSTKLWDAEAWCRMLTYDEQYIVRFTFNFPNGFSVRCLKDTLPACSPLPDPADAGQDMLNIPGTSIQLQGNQPASGTGVWRIFSGQGGSFADSTLHNTTFSGLVGETYALTWTTATACAYSEDKVVIEFVAAQSFNCGDPLIDVRDGQQYPTVLIGSQCWMAKNLNYGAYKESIYIYGSNHSDVSNNDTVEKYCQGNDVNNCSIYGGLYEWNEMMDYTTTEGVQGICPPNGGWHIPTDAEWTILTDYLGGTGVAAGKMKEADTLHWLSPNTDATDSVGFTALPGGYRTSYGGFSLLRYSGEFWSSTLYSLSLPKPWYRNLFNNSGSVTRNYFYSNQYDGKSVRCVRDSVICFPLPDQANAGPDSLNVTGTSKQLQGNQPVNGNGVWTIISGPGGNLTDSSLYNTMFFGQPGSSYTLAWTITNNCGSSSDNVNLSFATSASFTCGDTFTDPRDGQHYPTKYIGTQCWMTKNLNTGTYTASIYTGGNHSDVSNNGIIEKYCYNNDTSNCSVYGGMYDWNEMMNYDTTEGVQGICPPGSGWHIPTGAEWAILIANLGGETVAGAKLREADTFHWFYPNYGATNSSGFTGLPGGYRSGSEDFANLGYYGYFWESSVHSPGLAWSRLLYFNDEYIYQAYNDQTLGFSVRCVGNAAPCTPQPDQANAGPDSLNIPGDSIQLDANQPANGTGVWRIVTCTGSAVACNGTAMANAFADSTLYNSVFYGVSGVSYTLAWTISNTCGSSADTLLVEFVANQGFNCGDPLNDVRDGQQYPTVFIGNQCWMAKNLNIGTFVTSINTGSEHSDVTDNGIIEKYCYDNDTNNCLIYGGLYDWDEMMGYVITPGVQGICPTGWHIPTDAEWKLLEGSVDSTFGPGSLEWENNGNRGSDAGGNLKEAGILHWVSPNAGATNSSGFNAYPGGYRIHSGFFNSIGYVANFWTSSESYQIHPWIRGIYTNGSTIYKAFWNKPSGNSVRCLLDSLPHCNPQPEQANAGTDSLDVTGNSIQLQANQPTVGSGSWSFISGSGGSFSNRKLNNAIFYGQPGTTYVLAWTITNNCGNSSDYVTIGFAATPNITCIDTLTDARDGQKYPVVGIGNQCWMARNLNIGMIVSSVTGAGWHSDQTNNGIIEKYCHNNDSANCAIYGGLYEWEEMMEYTLTPGTKGICPQGWHLPSEAEWNVLVSQLGGPAVAGGKLKEAGYSYWQSPNIDATNSSGFTALPGGSRYDDGSFNGTGYGAFFWTSSANQYAQPLERTLSNWDAAVGSTDNTPFNGNSVRCIQDFVQPCTPQPDQANAGPDSLLIPADSIILQANTPVNGSGQWAVITGQGGVFNGPTDPASVFHGIAGTAYTLVWTISTSCGSSSDTLNISFAASQVFSCGGNLIDSRDGQQYPTVIIGTQCWMAKNLNIGVYTPSFNTGVTHSDVSNNGIIEKYCYNNDTSQCTLYGGLYDWDEMMGYLITPGIQGICAAGWHLPTDAEWTTLTDYLGGQTVAGGKLKEAGTAHWNSPNTDATNSSGFTALPGEYRGTAGMFTAIQGNYGRFWTSSPYTPASGAALRSIIYNSATVGKSLNAVRTLGYSVRCVKD